MTTVPQRPLPPSPPPDTTQETFLVARLELATDHLFLAAEIAEQTAPRQGRAGMIRAAIACVSIAADYRAAEDYGPSATADEILRYVLGELATLPPADRRCRRCGAPTNPSAAVCPACAPTTTT